VLTHTSRIVPLRGARMMFFIFIASSTQTCCPVSTASPGRTATSTITPGMGARIALALPFAVAGAADAAGAAGAGAGGRTGCGAGVPPGVTGLAAGRTIGVSSSQTS